MHAFGYAAESGVREVVIPLGNGASTLSAYGIASGDVVLYHELERSLLAPIDGPALATAVAGVRGAALAELAATGVTGEPVVEIDALMRYREQLMHGLEIPVPASADAGTLLADFDKEYMRRYGEGGTALFQAVEVFALRARDYRVPAGIPIARPELAAPVEPSRPASTGPARLDQDRRVPRRACPDRRRPRPSRAGAHHRRRPARRITVRRLARRATTEGVLMTIWDGVQRGYIPGETLRIPGTLKLHAGAADVDPVTFEVIRYSLMNTNLEHGQTIQRLAVSPVTMITRDFQPSILTESGDLVFLGPYLQYFSNAQALTIKWILENRAGNPGIEPGDMFVSNDPYVGTPHQPDMIVAAPVFVGDELFCWVANVMHHADVGGSVMGSFCVDATDMFTDPPAFPPFKLVSRGEVRQRSRGDVPAPVAGADRGAHGPARRDIGEPGGRGEDHRAGRPVRRGRGEGRDEPGARRRRADGGATVVEDP